MRARTALGFGVTAVVLATALTALAHGLVRRSLIEDRQQTATRQAYTDARLVRTGLRATNPDVPDLLAGLQVGPSSQVLLHRDGRWYSSSAAADPTTVPLELRRGVFDGRAGRQTYRSDGEPYFAVGVPLPAFNAYFFEVTSVQDIERTVELLARSLGIASVLAGALIAAAAWFLSATVLRPLTHMASAARSIVAGALDTRLDAEGDRDLTPLVTAFNEMLDELRSRIEREARFASDVSHELRGPLAALAAAVDVVNRRRSELPARAVTAVDALSEQVASFNRLVLDLLEISRFDAGAAEVRREAIELAALVHSVVAERGADVPVQTPRGEVFVEGDRRRLRQVVSNLLDNAANYAGGAVRVVVSREDGCARVAVDDAGQGVPVGERDEVFERFHRGSAADEPQAPRGSGLGLALVREHVTLHGGSAWVEDSPDGGARFLIEIPERQ